MSARGPLLTVSRLLSGRPVYTAGRLLVDETRETPILLDPATGGELGERALPAFILSTDREATDGHIVRQHWDLSRAGSVGIPILWVHQSRGDLLGQWRELGVVDLDGDKLIGRTDFDMDHPLAAQRAGQVRRGYVRAVSIGWQPGESTRRGDLDEKDPRWKAKSEDECGQPGEGLVMGSPEKPNRLFECSLVPVPADDGAFAIERALTGADDALSRGALTGPDLDTLLTGIASHPAARAYLARKLDQMVAERLASILARLDLVEGRIPRSPTNEAGIVRFT